MKQLNNCHAVQVSDAAIEHLVTHEDAHVRRAGRLMATGALKQIQDRANDEQDRGARLADIMVHGVEVGAGIVGSAWIAHGGTEEEAEAFAETVAKVFAAHLVAGISADLARRANKANAS